LELYPWSVFTKKRGLYTPFSAIASAI